MFVRDKFGNPIFTPRNICFAEGEEGAAGAGGAEEGAAGSAASGEGAGAEAAAATHLHAGQAAQQAGQVSGLQRVDCHADLHAALIQRGLLAVHDQRWQCRFGVARNRAAQRRHQGQALQVCRQIRPGEAHGESIGNRQTVAAWQLPSVRFALRDHGT